MPASSENTTWAWDATTSTGTFAWTGTSYNSTELFSIGNYSAYTTLNLVTKEGTANHFRIIIKFTNGADQVTINPVAAGTVSVNLLEHTTVENLSKVQTIRLSGANDVKPGDVTVSNIYLEGPDINYIEEKTIQVAPTGTVDLNGITGTGAAWNIVYPLTIADATLFGSYTIDGDAQSADIDSYDYLLFNVSEASADAKTYLRAFVSTANSSNNDTRVCLYPHPIAEYASVSDWTAETTITEPGIYVVKISDYPLLRGIKNKAYWQGSAGSIKISLAYVGSGTPVAPIDKVVRVGEEALTDASATCIDVTKLAVTGISFDAANPNCLFIAKAGQLTNTKNVIVDGVCANLALTDGYPFKAPADFTATAASYTTTITAAGAGTLCLPFDATIPGGVEAWTLAYTSGDAAVATPVETTIPANTPVLLNGSGDQTFTGASAAVSASATNKAGALTGVFAAATVPVNSYVLQKQSEKVGFFKVTGAKTINPFRAYLTAETPAPGLSIIFPEDNDVTGISEIEKMRNADNVTIFDLQGRKVAQPAKGLYIVNGKKVIFK